MYVHHLLYLKCVLDIYSPTLFNHITLTLSQNDDTIYHNVLK